MPMKIEDADLPPLFRAADSVSVRSQKIYLRCLAADLILIAIAGVAGAIALESHDAKVTLAWIAAISMAGGFVLTLYIKGRQFEHNWFDGRAVAESVKTSAWRFIMGTEPYDHNLSETDAVLMFTDSLKNVIAERKRFAALLTTEVPENHFQVTPKMLEVRKYAVDEKKAIYLEERLNNQRQWYANKASANVRNSNRWFNAILAAQGFGLLSTYVLVNYPELPILLPSVFATVAAAFVAWLQLKRHQELASSYGLAAQELSFIATQINVVEDLEKLSSFVADAENAISREHTMWVARRDEI